MPLILPYILNAYAALFVFGLLDNLRGPYFPAIISDLNLTDAQGGWFFASASLAAFVSSYYSPKLLPKLGPIGGLRLGLFSAVVGFGGIPLCQNFTQLVSASIFFGFGLGLLQVFMHLCIQEGAAPQQRMRLFNGLHSMYALASLFAPLLASLFFNLGWNWRKSFIIFCALPIAAFVQSFFSPNRKIESSEPDDLKARGNELKHIIYFAIFISLYVAAELAISTRLVLYVNRTKGLDLSQASHFLTGFFAALFVGRIFFALVNVRGLPNNTLVLIGIGLSFLLNVGGLMFSPWLMSLTALTMAPVYATGMDIISNTFQRKASLAMSYTLALGSLVVVSMHTMIGWLTDQVGIAMAMYIGPALLLVSFVLAAFREKLYLKI